MQEELLPGGFPRSIFIDKEHRIRTSPEHTSKSPHSVPAAPASVSSFELTRMLTWYVSPCVCVSPRAAIYAYGREDLQWSGVVCPSLSVDTCWAATCPGRQRRCEAPYTSLPWAHPKEDLFEWGEDVRVVPLSSVAPGHARIDACEHAVTRPLGRYIPASGTTSPIPCVGRFESLIRGARTIVRRPIRHGP